MNFTIHYFSTPPIDLPSIFQPKPQKPFWHKGYFCRHGEQGTRNPKKFRRKSRNR